MVTTLNSALARQHLATLKTSYLYLRLSLIGVVAAIFLAIWLTPNGFKPEGADILRSISHYYYTPARIVFTAALCAAALALIAISGRGVQSYLLDLAALLAPLIAIVPTRTLASEVGANAELGSCVAGWPAETDCIPANQLPYVEVGFGVWFCFAIAGLLLALIRGLSRLRNTEKREPAWYWIVLVAGAVFVSLYGAWWLSPEFASLQVWGHITAAATFFIIIMLVAVIEAVRQFLGRNTRTPAFLPRRAYAVIYGLLAVVLAADIIVAVVVLVQPKDAPIGDAVFWIEVIGLIAFALFWVFQTVEHLRDADGWESPSPRNTWNPRNSTPQAALQQDLAIAGYYDANAIDGVIGPDTRAAVNAVKADANITAPDILDETGGLNMVTATAIRNKLAV